MEDYSNQTSHGMNKSRIRFSLRSILVATALAAASVSAVTPWFQEWNTEQRKAFFLVWANLGLSAAATAVLGCVARVREERRAGKLRFKTSLSSSLIGNLAAIGFAITLASAVVGYSFHVAEISTEVAAARVFDSTLVKFGIFLGAAGLAIWWRTASAEICDAGIILSGWRFIPWQLIRGYRWSANIPNMLVLQCQRAVVTVQVNPCDKAAVEQFLTSRPAANAVQPHIEVRESSRGN